jgi:hypothetical protein
MAGVLPFVYLGLAVLDIVVRRCFRLLVAPKLYVGGV